MVPITLTGLGQNALLLMDSAPIIYQLEGHAQLGPRFISIFEAQAAARLRATLKLKLPDAVQAASALAIGADALVTHDRDFSRLQALRVIC